eukprot:6182197-Pleurochrysis_carterae.AAC.2
MDFHTHLALLLGTEAVLRQIDEIAQSDPVRDLAPHGNTNSSFVSCAYGTLGNNETRFEFGPRAYGTVLWRPKA